MIRFINHYLKIALTTVACAFATTSCQDDLWFGDNGPEEGLPATIKLSVEVGDMDVKTRSIVDEEARNYCDDVWVGVYLESTGKCIYNHVYTVEPGNRQETSETNYGLYEFNIETKSGRSRIVAVSNLDNEEASATPDGEHESLRDALAAADTWDKFKQVTVHKDNVGDVAVRTGTLMMSGYYQGNDTVAGDYDMPMVDIKKGENILTGAIHLRRLTSYNKVNINAGENINMTLNTWKVCNIPTDSYVFESDETGNAGALVSADKNPYGDSGETHIFSLSEDKAENGNDIFSFEFYQYENCHTACDYQETVGTTEFNKTDYVGISSEGLYNDREREYKSDPYTDESTGDTRYTNLAIYKSLVNDKTDTTALKNNDASYFVFTADLDYYILDTDENRKYPGKATPVNYAEETAAGKALIHRTVSATYTVHLGYCEHKDADGNPTVETAKDFNCRRNTKYTYNIEVQGANKIVVEAKKEGELQSGAEGSVLDDYGDYVAMDSHYCVYNIALTNKERNQLLYRVSSPFNGTTYVYESKNYNTIDSKTGEKRGEAWENDQLFTWIKIKPTTSMDVLAKYKENENDNNLWSLNDLLDVKGHPWAEWTIKDDGTVDASNEDRDETSEIVHYYTVFVDEYVYHNDINGNPEGNLESLWYTYVNQDDRVVQLFLNNDYSPDSESDYTFCKYAFAQKSIQTYYKYDGDDAEVMGVEHTDENYGLNYDWYYVDKYSDWGTEDRAVLSPDNGRYNLNTTLDTMEVRKVFTKEWKNFVSSNTPDKITAGSNTYFDVSHEAALYPVPKLAALGGTRWDSYHWNNDKQVHYMNVACMNRNRDLDGDGIISQKELRWYLPTGNEYVQLSICQNELKSPLIAVLLHNKNEFAISGETDRTLIKRMTPYHYATSDNRYFWAEEIGSLGDRPFGHMQPNKQMCYALRCIRNLGANPATTPTKENEIHKPYSYDSGTLTFTQDRFSDVSLRSYVGTYILPHDVGSETARPYKQFKEARNFCKNITDEGLLSVNGSGVVQWIDANDEGTKTYHWYQSLMHNGICGQYYENSDKSDKGTWRVPTLVEMGIMYTEKTLGGCYQLSCSRSHFLVFNGEYGYTAGYTDAFPYEFFGYHAGDDLLKKSVMMNAPGSIHVRCVKDVR